MTHEFFGREQELQELDRWWALSKEEFLILYGRRRIGKTALLAEWIHGIKFWLFPKDLDIQNQADRKKPRNGWMT